MIKDDVEIGEGTIIYQPDLVNLYGCKIGKNCRIGAFVEIGAGVTIGDNCKIQAFVFIPPGVTIGNNVFIGPHTCFTNDKYPKAGPEFRLIETEVQDNASIGANCTILCGIIIGAGTLVGAGSVVTKSTVCNSIVYGNRAR